MLGRATPFLVVFVAMFALDFIWARYTQALTEYRAMPAALWAAVLIVLSGVAQTGYISDPWLFAPAALGAFAGTYVSMRLPCKG